jgi:hypothetical protein
LFDEFERIFPSNVKMVSVYPQIDDEQINILMEVAGKSLNDIVDLISVLQKAPAFSEVVLKSERQQTDGFLHAAISLTYRPEKLANQVQPQTQTAPAPADTEESEESTESTR